MLFMEKDIGTENYYHKHLEQNIEELNAITDGFYGNEQLSGIHYLSAKRKLRIFIDNWPVDCYKGRKSEQNGRWNKNNDEEIVEEIQNHENIELEAGMMFQSQISALKR